MMQFPILIIKKNKAPLYVFDEQKFGLVSNGGEKFYLQSRIYDSNGFVYDVKSILGVKRAPVLKSLVFFQRMFITNLDIEKGENVALETFKELVCEHIDKHKTYWRKRDSIDELSKEIMNLKRFEDIILFLR